MDKALQDVFNQQIGHELYSSNLYLAMSAWCGSQNLPGFASWLMTQANEERGHALKLLEHLVDRGGAPAIPAVPAPPAAWDSVAHVFRQVAEHEKKVTGLFHRLHEAALSAKDYAAQVELAWFVKEQVEEEKSAEQWAAHLAMVGDKSAAILNLDHRAGKRGGS
ncbi:MAG: ferritin [Deltaproteobacteria bacterium]|nr:ferritin [Deltaproteobacteria bacterium]